MLKPEMTNCLKKISDSRYITYMSSVVNWLKWIFGYFVHQCENDYDQITLAIVHREEVVQRVVSGFKIS